MIICLSCFFFFKQKTAYEMRISDWSSDVCSSDLARTVRRPNYDLISPIEEDETPGDEDSTRGNPELRNEKAWGVDVGYERSLGSRGIRSEERRVGKEGVSKCRSRWEALQ